MYQDLTICYKYRQQIGTEYLAWIFSTFSATSNKHEEHTNRMKKKISSIPDVALNQFHLNSLKFQEQMAQ